MSYRSVTGPRQDPDSRCAAALAFEDHEDSLLQLDALTAGLAATLHHRGVCSGQRVALMSSNRAEFVPAVRALWRLGAAVVLISPSWKRGEVEHALAVTEPAHAVGDHEVLADLMPMLHLDEPIATAQGAYTPEDEHSSGSSMSLRAALRTSSNRAAVRLLQEVGIARTVQNAKMMGVGDVPSVPTRICVCVRSGLSTTSRRLPGRIVGSATGSGACSPV